MDVFTRIDLNLVALVVCAGMVIASLRASEKRMIHNRLFRWLILSTSLLLALEILCRIAEDRPGQFAYIVHLTGGMLICLLTPLPPLLWALYSHYQLLHDVRRLKRAARALSIPVGVSALLTLSTPFTGLMFAIGGGSTYQRGPLFPVLIAVSFLPIVFSIVTCIVYRRRTLPRLVVPMLLFALPPVVGAVFQTFFYGITVLWSSFTVSIFIIHASVQSHQHNLDPLTGVFGRRQLDNYLNDRIYAAQKCHGTGFACIMLDIDGFRKINDTHGHAAGDTALRDAAAILKTCIRSGDFLARYAGDEFLIVLDTASPDALKKAVKRIHQRTGDFNRTGGKPYSLSFSIGAALYDPSARLSREDFLAHVDALLHNDKNKKKASRAFFLIH